MKKCISFCKEMDATRHKGVGFSERNNFKYFALSNYLLPISLEPSQDFVNLLKFLRSCYFFFFFGLVLFLISETFRMEPSYTKLHKTEDSHWP